MDSLYSSVKRIFKDAIKSFYRFPASLASAIVISIVAIVKVEMDWEVQESYNFLLNSIQAAAFIGAAVSMALVALDEVKKDSKGPSFISLNIAGIALAAASGLLLYFFGGIVGGEGISSLSNIALARVFAAVFISIVGFIYITSKSKAVESFSGTFLIAHKAFFISAIYGLVIMAGVSGVIGAFQALIYNDLSGKVYQYLGVVVGFLTYAIFLGYFPSFRGTQGKAEVETLEEQPRFIFVLFGYILVPIIMALTVVLLLWSSRVILSGMDVSFTRLSGIASSYVVVGIWLHIMVANHRTKLANFYRKAYPFAGILILIFQAWALFVRLGEFGFKTEEYSFLMLWIFAVISVLLLIVSKERPYRKLAIVAMAISVIWVLPVVGYQDVTFNSQVGKLESILADEGYLSGGSIAIPAGELEEEKKAKITEAVDFIDRSEKSGKPSWFMDDLSDQEVFEDFFGFKKTYSAYPKDSENIGSYFTLEPGVIDIGGYNHALNIDSRMRGSSSIDFEGRDGSYELIWENEPFESPKITLKLEGDLVIEEDLGDYILDLEEKYPNSGYMASPLPVEDMSVTLQGKGVELLVVFNDIDSYYDESREEMDYYVSPYGIYISYVE